MESFETNKDQFLTWEEFLRVVTTGMREKAKKTNRTNDVYTDPSAWQQAIIDCPFWVLAKRGVTGRKLLCGLKGVTNK